MPTDLVRWEAGRLCEAALADAGPDLAGPHHEEVEAGADEAIRTGGAVLLRLARVAVGRYVRGGGGHQHAGHQARGLLSDDELLLLAEVLESTLRAAGGLAQALLLDRMHGLAKAELGGAARESDDFAALCSTLTRDAMRLHEGAELGRFSHDFFRLLLRALATDPKPGAPALARRALTLAVTTSQELLAKVQDAIAERILTGRVVGGPKAVSEILDLAGVSVRNSGYAEAVFRTNYMEHFREQTQSDLSQSTDTFPVWRYCNPRDVRSRPLHAAHAQEPTCYYPSTVAFSYVRGTEPEDVINCRCLPAPIDRRTWSARKAKGARLADGYEEPAAGVLG